MTQRPRSHQIDAQGQALLAHNFPKEWAVKPLMPDYGVDYQVEIFEASGDATGIMFLVQLRSTERSLSKGDITLPLDIKALSYWKSLTLPVLLVISHVGRRELRQRWIHDMDPWPRGSDQKSKTFRLGPSDVWGAGTPAEIRAYADAWRAWREKGAAPFPVPLSVDCRPEEGALEETRVRDALRSELEPHRHIIYLTASRRSDVSGIMLTCSRQDTRFAVPASAHMVFDHPKGSDWDEDSLGPDLIVGLALILGRAGFHEQASTLLASVAHRTTFWTTLPLGVAMAGVLAAGSRASLAVDIAESLETSEPTSLLGAAILAHLGPSDLLSEPERNRVWQIFRRRYERLKDTDAREAATAAYNVGSTLRPAGQHEEALDWYERAANTDPDYKNRPYWHRERGGMLYLLERYEESADAYATATALGDDDPLLPATFADALIGSGQYSSAAEQLGLARDLPEVYRAEVHLLQRTVEAIRTSLGADTQDRDPDAARRLLLEMDGSWQEGLRLDALCPAVWLQRATLERSVEYFVIAAALARYSDELWAAATAECARAHDEALGRDCTTVARHYVGIGLLDQLSRFRQEGPVESSQEETVLKWFDEAPIADEPNPIIRLHHLSAPD